MEINYELLEDDYIKFNLYNLRQSETYKREIYIQKYILNSVLAFMIFVIGTFILKQPMLYWTLIAILFLIVQIKTNEKQNEKREIKKIKKYLEEGENKFLFGKKTLKIENEKIYIKSELSEEIKDKKSIIDVKIYDDLIVLYESSITAEIIPKRYVEEDKVYKLISLLKK
ncbi:Uncharacterised protein [[Clostridium] sordellii]|uniref:hypothetical protein n=1 Tax=Paraclostridium sordellii TaxID=1505 RepID=UPI0005E72B1B|nr:hypothetical protein [Paeniclostridium sordellii]CEP45924.1 Uncharacterised protein [[Clostridium] sordellii] [Paeniclostridium sordellii]